MCPDIIETNNILINAAFSRVDCRFKGNLIYDCPLEEFDRVSVLPEKLTPTKLVKLKKTLVVSKLVLVAGLGELTGSYDYV